MHWFCHSLIHSTNTYWRLSTCQTSKQGTLPSRTSKQGTLPLHCSGVGRHDHQGLWGKPRNVTRYCKCDGSFTEDGQKGHHCMGYTGLRAKRIKKKKWKQNGRGTKTLRPELAWSGQGQETEETCGSRSSMSQGERELDAEGQQAQQSLKEPKSFCHVRKPQVQP